MTPCPSERTVLLALGVMLFIVPASSLSLTPGSSFDGAPVIANGDPVFIHGIATGHPAPGLQVWLIGKNYVKISTVYTNQDNTYEYELRPADTRTLAPGQYFVLVQHPMMNAEFDIYYDSASGGVFNRQLGGGVPIFQLTGPGSLQRPDAGYALMNAINSQNVDDTFALTSFVIGNPVAAIDPIGDHHIGDTFTITGSTNLAVGSDLLVEIYSSSFTPTRKTQGGGFAGASGTVTVAAGPGGMNTWSFPVDASTFPADEYLVKVSAVTNDVTGSAAFRILGPSPPPVTTVSPSPGANQTATLPATIPEAVPPTTASPIPPGTILVASGLAAAIAHLKRH